MDFLILVDDETVEYTQKVISLIKKNFCKHEKIWVADLSNKKVDLGNEASIIKVKGSFLSIIMDFLSREFRGIVFIPVQRQPLQNILEEKKGFLNILREVQKHSIDVPVTFIPVKYLK
ncbi:MAG: hypothetical protein DSY32_05135 [Aquifex sp.]|nr:MAG: hypothetical protein DSY32_05135 [Aquifex sp.]